MAVAFVVAVVALVLAVAFFFQWQSAASVVKALREDADSSRREADAARAEVRKAQEELRARGAQLQETREKLTESRKRAQEGKAGKAQSRGAREAELEEDLQHARKLNEEAHASETAARRDLQAARAEASQARTELEKALARVRELAERPAPTPVAVPEAPRSEEADGLRQQLEAAKTELERQVRQAERAAHDSKRREQDLRDEIRKHKGRAETNNRVYLVTKGELEVTRERLAQAERKLWQAGIPLAAPQPKERPRAKGPAAAPLQSQGAEERTASDSPAPGEDRAAGERAAGVEAEDSARHVAHLEPQADASPDAGEPISEGETDSAPPGVAPIRRRVAENGVHKPPQG